MDPVSLSDTTAPQPHPALSAACTNGDLLAIFELLDTQYDAPVGCSELLGIAAANGHSDIVRFLLNKYDKQQLAVHRGHALKATYSKGAECYRLIYEREPAAVARSNVELLNFLLERGGDPGWTITDETPVWFHQWIPIETAALCATTEVTKILLRHGASPKGTSALKLAAGNVKRMQLDVVKCLIEAGAAINATGMDTEPRLMQGWSD
ncbi:MAG: hypothetical protein Q9222_006404 [Ikaeria aurantiellina]